jgi:hypothetical protein
VAALCCLAGARQLDAAAVGALLKDPVLFRSVTVAAALCKLPAAASIETAVLQELQQSAARVGDAGMFEAWSSIGM